MGSLEEHDKSQVRLINLSNKPLLFSSEGKLIDEQKITSFITEVSDKYPKLEILDFSLNRLTEECLPYFLPLLLKDSFKYLDISINSGADSLEGMRLLSSRMEEKGIVQVDQVNIFKKIIWAPKSHIIDEEGKIRENVFLPKTYVDAHKDYYENKLQSSSGFQLPY